MHFLLLKQLYDTKQSLSQVFFTDRNKAMGLCSVPAQFNLYVATVKEVGRRLSAPSVSLKNAFDMVVIQDIDLAAFWPDSITATQSSHWEDVSQN